MNVPKKYGVDMTIEEIYNATTNSDKTYDELACPLFGSFEIACPGSVHCQMCIASPHNREVLNKEVKRLKIKKLDL